MSLKKREIRKRFFIAVMTRDNYCCRVCKAKEPDTEMVVPHHIVDRDEIEGGGYVLQNGIALCTECHHKAEVYHSSNKTKYFPGFHPKDLLLLISQ